MEHSVACRGGEPRKRAGGAPESHPPTTTTRFANHAVSTRGSRPVRTRQARTPGLPDCGGKGGEREKVGVGKRGGRAESPTS